MSARPAASAMLTAHITRFRRRAAAVIFIRWLSIAASATLVAAAASVVLHLATSMAAVSTASGAAVVIAALIAAARTPSARATAAAVDRNLPLHDRGVTAVQCAAADDPFSQLVVRDAVARLAAVNSAEVFPLQLPRVAIVVSLAACAVIVAAAGLPDLPGFGVTRTRFTPAGAATTPVATPRQAGLAADQQPATTATAPTAVTSAAMGTAAPAQRTGASGEPPGRERGESTAAAASDSEKSKEAPTASPAVAAAMGAGLSDRGAAAPGSAALRESERAGGVSGGDATPRRGASSRPPHPEVQTYAAAYRTGRTDAETAIVQDRIPPERRAHVRRYFESIRPQDLK
jgi:hypothetical protein